MRVLFYCHNVLGLGHIARSITLANAVRGTVEDAECSLVTGCRFLDVLDLPPHVRVETLPAARLGSSGRLLPARGEGDVVADRGARLEEVIADTRPQVVVVDQRPLGLGGELMGVLERAGKESWPTAFVWGIPYLEDSSLTLRRPRNPRIRSALALYRAALVYDEPSAVDVDRAYGDYGLPEHTVHVGLVTRPAPEAGPAAEPPLVSCLCGGGTSAVDLLQLLLGATGELRRTGELRLRFVAGPFGDRSAISAAVEGEPQLDLLWSADPAEALAGASAVVARSGYNTAGMLLRSELPVVFVPLPKRGDEQTYRARRLDGLEGVWCVDPRDGDAAVTLRGALADALSRGRGMRGLPFRVDGAAIAAREIASLAGTTG